LLLAASQAIRARAEGAIEVELSSLMLAGDFAAAHALFVKHLAQIYLLTGLLSFSPPSSPLLISVSSPYFDQIASRIPM
jgi:hypothetical protein